MASGKVEAGNTCRQTSYLHALAVIAIVSLARHRIAAQPGCGLGQVAMPCRL